MRISDWSSDVCSSDLPSTYCLASAVHKCSKLGRVAVFDGVPACRTRKPYMFFIVGNRRVQARAYNRGSLPAFGANNVYFFCEVAVADCVRIYRHIISKDTPKPHACKYLLQGILRCRIKHYLRKIG